MGSSWLYVQEKTLGDSQRIPREKFVFFTQREKTAKIELKAKNEFGLEI